LPAILHVQLHRTVALLPVLKLGGGISCSLRQPPLLNHFCSEGGRREGRKGRQTGALPAAQPAPHTGTTSCTTVPSHATPCTLPPHYPATTLLPPSLHLTLPALPYHLRLPPPPAPPHHLLDTTTHALPSIPSLLFSAIPHLCPPFTLCPPCILLPSRHFGRAYPVPLPTTFPIPAGGKRAMPNAYDGRTTTRGSNAAWMLVWTKHRTPFIIVCGCGRRIVCAAASSLAARFIDLFNYRFCICRAAVLACLPLFRRGATRHCARGALTDAYRRRHLRALARTAA